MEEFETSSKHGIGNGGVRANFRLLKSGMEERAKFEARNRKWRRSSQVPTLGIGMQEFEASSKLGIGNGGVRAKFRSLESGMEEI